MTLDISFYKKKEKLLEEKVRSKYCILEDNDSDLAALGKVNPNNELYLMTIASIAVSNQDYAKARQLMRNVENPFSDSFKGTIAISIYNRLRNLEFITGEDFNCYIDDLIAKSGEKELLELAAGICIESQDYKNAFKISRKLNNKEVSVKIIRSMSALEGLK
ncbi:hypothetical protein KY308_01065 [Candidatus Woesearchaeota archaeon]|nr:hypothetical protein [Candidatus Woesearchaeota archaeon]